MQRPLGVTASAIVGFFGSVLAAIVSVAMGAAAFLASVPDPAFPRVAIILCIVGLVFAAAGLVTNIGVYRLRAWARTSMLVFATAMTIVCALALVVLWNIPMPATPELGARAPETIRRVALLIYGIPLLIGVWWLVEFNRPSTKAAFETGAPAEPARLPVSLALIAWFNIAGGIMTLLGIPFRPPAFFAGFVMTGWSATIYYTVFGALSIYLGRGILRLDERARLVTIGWFALTILQSAFVALSPWARARLRELRDSLGAADAPGMNDMRLTLVLMVLGCILFAAAIWPLVQHRDRFAPRD